MTLIPDAPHEVLWDRVLDAERALKEFFRDAHVGPDGIGAFEYARRRDELMLAVENARKLCKKDVF